MYKYRYFLSAPATGCYLVTNKQRYRSRSYKWSAGVNVITMNYEDLRSLCLVLIIIYHLMVLNCICYGFDILAVLRCLLQRMHVVRTLWLSFTACLSNVLAWLEWTTKRSLSLVNSYSLFSTY